ncbi:MAG TPA: hydrogenase [Lentisphaeria bacterium]|nr:MAG: hydrogenase [Lentisphaerae bacterium GWF2_49_21]HBC86957.1 hydrogenase [Lentisphaeria bacterium]
MNISPYISVFNGETVKLENVPVLDFEEFRETLLSLNGKNGRLSSLFGMPVEYNMTRIFAIIAKDRLGNLCILSTEVGDSYKSLTPDCPQAHWFEREIAEQWGIVPEGHPWLKPIRFHKPYSEDRDAWKRKEDEEILPCVTDYYKVDGEEIHEVAVGPVHAGIIEPGHFRFQCHGETVFNLEISLGYQHRGIERKLVGAPDGKTIHYMETAAGDTSIGHATAYCEALESLAKCNVPLRAQAIRGILLELERLANHAGDLGALAGDVAYLPTSSFCGRIRGDYLNITALICGNRFGRNVIRPGGVMFDIDNEMKAEILKRLDAAFKDTENAVDLLWDNPSVQGRFEECGKLSRELCTKIGTVGPAARACGVEQDVRFDLPSGIFRFAQISVSTYHTGDVFSRAFVRMMEIRNSVKFIREQLANLPEGKIMEPCGKASADSLTVTLAEGWRGEICHTAITDSKGHFEHYKIVDPSFHNWFALANVLKNEQIYNFPLCNKSFNLSYCGHDL